MKPPVVEALERVVCPETVRLEMVVDARVDVPVMVRRVAVVVAKVDVPVTPSVPPTVWLPLTVEVPVVAVFAVR